MKSRTSRPASPFLNAGSALVWLPISASLLFGVRPLDAATFAAMVLVLAVTAAAAVIGPAWRAARVDPAGALRAG